MLTSLSTPATTAIENSRIYQRARREIANRIQAEADLEQERALLARRVEVRTAELRRQYRRQRALAAIEPSINHPDKLETVLRQIVTSTRHPVLTGFVGSS